MCVVEQTTHMNTILRSVHETRRKRKGSGRKAIERVANSRKHKQTMTTFKQSDINSINEIDANTHTYILPDSHVLIRRNHTTNLKTC